MGVLIIWDNKLAATTWHKTFHSNFIEDVDKNIKYEIDLEHIEFSAEHAMKNEIRQLWTQKTVKSMNHTILFLTCQRD